MKKTFLLLSLILFTLCTISCSNKIEQPIEEEDEYNYITFNPIINSDLEMTEEPLSKSSEEVIPKHYLINISKYNENTESYELYAYAIVESLNDLKLKVNRNSKYKVREFAAYTTDVLSEYDIRLEGGGQGYRYIDLTDGFIYENTYFSVDYWSKKSDKSFCFLIEGDGYQADFNSVEFEGNATSIDVALNRFTMGISFSVIGLEEGTIRLEIKSSSSTTSSKLTYLLTKEAPSVSKLFIGTVLAGYSSGGHRIYATYISPEGEETTLISNERFYYSPSKRKVFELTLNYSDNSESNLPFSATINYSEIEDEETVNYDATI